MRQMGPLTGGEQSVLPQQCRQAALGETVPCIRLTAASAGQAPSAMRSHACGKHGTINVAPVVYPHLCEITNRTAFHPCGCRGVA